MRLDPIAVSLAALVSLAVPGTAQNALDPFSLFASADANRDGSVSKAEFLARRAQTFPQIDRSGDGYLSLDELQSQAQNMQGRFMARSLFGTFDANGDGRISNDEFAVAPAPMFDRADANKDGSVSQAELDAVRP